MRSRAWRAPTSSTAADLVSGWPPARSPPPRSPRAYLDRIAAEDGELGSYLHVDPEAALARAAEIDAAGDAGTGLNGVPVALKDVVVTEGVPTTSGSKILEGWRPPYDATVAARLKAAGTVLLGKTNMDEFAMGSSTENSAYRITRNPWDPTASRAAPPAARRRPWPRASPRGPSAPTPAARSASPRR